MGTQECVSNCPVRTGGACPGRGHANVGVSGAQWCNSNRVTVCVQGLYSRLLVLGGAGFEEPGWAEVGISGCQAHGGWGCTRRR